MLVSLGVLVPRYREPDRERPFRAPGSPLTEIFAVLARVCLIVDLLRVTRIRFVIWLIVGDLIYMCYGRRHSRLNAEG